MNMNTLPMDIVNKIMLYNSHPVAEALKKSKYIHDNHKRWDESNMYHNIHIVLDKGLIYPVYMRCCKLPTCVIKDYRNIYDKRFIEWVLYEDSSSSDSDSDSDY